MKSVPVEKSALRKRFEQNLLDGDDINDCGSAMINAKEALAFFIQEIESIDSVSQAIQAAVEEERKRIAEEVENIRKEDESCDCVIEERCGCKMIDFNAAIDTVLSIINKHQ